VRASNKTKSKNRKIKYCKREKLKLKEKKIRKVETSL